MKKDKQNRNRVQRAGLARAISWMMLSVLVSACATTDYTTHYGIFTAENSAGELRQFRVYWQTLRYEGWLENTFRARPLVLETQCSKRDVRFYDASFGSGRRCAGETGEGIQFCSRTDLDVGRRGQAIKNNTLCGVVTDRDGSTDLLSLSGDVMITMHCRPKSTGHTAGDKKIITDYLISSEIPYVVSTKSIKGANIDLLIPELSSHSSICDPDA